MNTIKRLCDVVSEFNRGKVVFYRTPSGNGMVAILSRHYQFHDMGCMLQRQRERGRRYYHGFSYPGRRPHHPKFCAKTAEAAIQNAVNAGREIWVADSLLEVIKSTKGQL